MGEGWREESLSVLADFTAGRNAPRAVRDIGGAYRLLGANGQIGNTKEHMHEGPLITVGRVGAYGAVHQVSQGEKCWVSDNALVVTAKSGTDFDFLRLLLETVDYDTIRSGTTQPLITQTSLSRVRVRVPTPSVQRRIVDLMGHTDNLVAALRRECAAIERLVSAFRESHFKRWRSEENTVSFGSITRDARRTLAVKPEGTYREIGVRSHGRGVFGKEARTGHDLGTKKMYSVSSGDLVFNIVFAWERAVAVLPDEFDGWASSHRFPTYRRVDGGSEEFLRQFFVSAWGNEELRLASPGGAGRNRTLGRKALDVVQVPQVPREQESEFLDQMRCFEQLSISLTRERVAAERARKTLLRSLFAQSIDIPAAYDSLLGVVA